MDDLISRHAAIDALDSINCFGWVEDSWKNVCSIIERVPTAQPEQQWIPVTGKLSEKYIGEWLCCTDDGEIMILQYDTPGDESKECVFYRWDDNGYFYQTFNVVALMPKPKPWKGDSKC